MTDNSAHSTADWQARWAALAAALVLAGSFVALPGGEQGAPPPAIAPQLIDIAGSPRECRHSANASSALLVAE